MDYSFQQTSAADLRTSHELRYEELQRQGNLRTSMEIQRRLSQKNSAKRNAQPQSSEFNHPTQSSSSSSQPRYPILDTSEIQQRSQSMAARRSTRRGGRPPPPSPPASPSSVSSRSRRGPTTTTTRPMLNRNYSRSHNKKSKPKAKLSNLYGVIDTNKLKLLCGDYYSEEYNNSASTRSIHLDPIPETEPSAPPYDGSGYSTYETAPNQSPTLPIGDNPYQTHSEYLFLYMYVLVGRLILPSLASTWIMNIYSQVQRLPARNMQRSSPALLLHRSAT